MSLEGRRTRLFSLFLSLYLCLCVHPIPVLILRESHFYRASYAHACSYGCALNYGLSSRARTTEDGSQIDHAEPAPRSRRAFSFLSASLSLFFFLIHPCPSRERSRPGRPREQRQRKRGCKRGGFVSPGRGNGFERFLFANEGIVGSTL